jgi:hypothetical protein
MKQRKNERDRAWGRKARSLIELHHEEKIDGLTQP